MAGPRLKFIRENKIASPRYIKKRLKKETSFPKLLKKADSLVSFYVIHRDRFCVTCGTSEGLTNSHLFKRGRIPLRFDLENCNCQCATCNGLHNTNPRPYENWFIGKFGQKKFDELQVRAWGIAKMNREEIWDVIRLMEGLIHEHMEVEWQTKINKLRGYGQG